MRVAALYRLLRRRRYLRMWEPTNVYELFWEPTGAVSLRGEQVDRLSGKKRWRRPNWLGRDEYREILRDLVSEWMEARS